MKDRLPTFAGDCVLGVYENGIVCQVHFDKWHEPEQWYDFYNNVWVATGDITHWKPLPEPPKGE